MYVSLFRRWPPFIPFAVTVLVPAGAHSGHPPRTGEQRCTIIEKIEAHRNVGFAVVLLTSDDLGMAKGAEHLQPRARQNVVLEGGIFISRLGRDRVCVLKRGELEVPSDYAGVVYEPMMRAAGGGSLLRGSWRRPATWSTGTR